MHWRVVCALLLTPLSAGVACDVPVFRYALERWTPDAYQAYVFHRGAPSEADDKLLDAFRQSASNGTSLLNVQVRQVDVDAPMEAPAAELWEKQSSTTLPRMVLTYPHSESQPRAAWSGRFTEESARLVADSPARREVARRLLAGDSVVWVFVESGDAAKDEATAARLQDLLAKIEEAWAPPPVREGNSFTNADAGLLGPGRVFSDGRPLVWRCSIHRIARNDPAEEVFVQMLLHTENGLEEVNEPIVFPIFGQGRVLHAIVGRGINEDNVGYACAFLNGPCSCEVKAENPGVDLLMAVHWDGLLRGERISDTLAPELTSLAAAGSEQTARGVPAAPSVATVDTNAGHSRIAAAWWYTIGVVTAAVAAGTLLIRRRSANREPQG